MAILPEECEEPGFRSFEDSALNSYLSVHQVEVGPWGAQSSYTERRDSDRWRHQELLLQQSAGREK